MAPRMNMKRNRLGIGQRYSQAFFARQVGFFMAPRRERQEAIADVLKPQIGCSGQVVGIELYCELPMTVDRNTGFRRRTWNHMPARAESLGRTGRKSRQRIGLET
jgi:hypothetical protein